MKIQPSVFTSIQLPDLDNALPMLKQSIDRTLNQHPQAKAILQTIGTAAVAAGVGSTLCAPIKTMNISLASNTPIQLSRILSSLLPQQLLPHCRAIATNNLTLLLPQLLAHNVVNTLPALKSLSTDKKQMIVNITAASFCSASFFNQAIATNNQLATGALGIDARKLAVARGRHVLLGAMAALTVRETCGLTGLTTADNPKLVKVATGLGTVADLTFANLSIIGQGAKLNPLKLSTYFATRSLEASLYFQGTHKALEFVSKGVQH